MVSSSDNSETSTQQRNLKHNVDGGEAGEREYSQVGIIVVEGMADLPDPAVQLINKALHADAFASHWDDPKENLKTKLERLNRQVSALRDQGKQVILVGVSAGAALSMAYLLQHPDEIRHIYSLSGLIDPDLNEMDLRHLTRDSSSFKEVAEFLTNRLTDIAVEELHLPDRVSAYYSEDDEIVPLAAAAPKWVRFKRAVGRNIFVKDKDILKKRIASRKIRRQPKQEDNKPIAKIKQAFEDMRESNTHVGPIAIALISDVQKQLKQLAQAKFD